MAQCSYFPPELLQIIFSFTSDVIFRKKYNAVRNKLEWECRFINNICKTNLRYKTLMQMPRPIKLYHSIEYIYNGRRDTWYYIVYFPTLSCGKKFILRCEDDYSGNYYTSWVCWKHHSENDLDELGFVRESLHHVFYHTIK
jgi:hypothetical protein